MTKKVKSHYFSLSCHYFKKDKQDKNVSSVFIRLQFAFQAKLLKPKILLARINLVKLKYMVGVKEN